MGGQPRGDSTHGGDTSDQATKSVIDQLNEKLAQDAGGQTRATPGVAPLAVPGGKGPGTDRYFHGTPGGRAHPSADGTLVNPGANGNGNGNGGGETVVPFSELHKDQQRQEGTPYERNNSGYVPPGTPVKADGSGRPAGNATDNHIQSLISKRGLYLSPWTPAWGGVGAVTAPLTAKLISRGADAVAERTTTGNFANKMATYWQQNYDATKVGTTGLVKPTVATSAADTEFSKLVADARKLSTTGADDAAKALASERLEMLSRPLNASTIVDINAASAARAETSGAALFNEAELKTIAAKYEANLARSAQEQAVITSLQKGGPSVFKAAKAGAIGITVDILAVNADRALAKYIGGENSLLKSYNTEQLLAPTALALGETVAGKNFWLKAGLVAGSIGVSRLIDGTTQAVGLGAPEAWNAPTGVMNGWDGFGVATGLAIAATAKNPYAKLAAVATGWGIPKIVHAFEDNSSNSLAYRYEDLKSTVESDHKKRTLSSLEGVVGASVSLNEKKEDWLVDKIKGNRDVLQKSWNTLTFEQRLLSLRDDAGMSKALGDFLLDKGTRIAKQGDPSYTLGGYQIDMGGRAMHYMISAEDSTDSAASLTQGIINNNKDSSKTKILVNGEEPSQSEVTDLNKFKDEIRENLAKILDQRHDCRAVVNEIAKARPSSSDDWRQTYIRPVDGLIERYTQRNTPAQVAETKQVLAKLYRDQAIAYMAVAKDALDNGNDPAKALVLLENGPGEDIFPSGRKKNYNGAEGVLAMATRFDPNNKDMPELKQLYDELHQRAKEAAAKGNNLDILGGSGQVRR